ncbi:MAG: dihydrolipoamide acetyltransferase family protein [Bacillus sp. (in: firmicutes)]
MIELKLPDIGEGMTEGEVIHYFFNEGDPIKADEPLVEVQTDKMVASLPSPATGVIRSIKIPLGKTVPVGTVLVSIDTGSSSAENSSEKQKTVQSTPKRQETQPSTTRTTISKRVLATPFTRKIAREHNIDIEQVTGKDPSGRITEQDVYDYLAKHTEKEIQPKSSMPDPSPSFAAIDSIPFRGVRRKISDKMIKSKYTIPHVTHFEEIDMTNLLHVKNEMKESGTTVSVTAFFIKALCIALKDHRVFNSKLDMENEQIILHNEYHIGVATDTAAGLIVPVILDADKKSIKQIHDEMKEIQEKSRNGQLTPSQLGGGTFTISNVGPMGSIGATPIINYPQAAIIAFHKTKKQPIINEQDEIVIRSMMNMSMSFDHRIADGASAVRFTNRFASLVEHPYNLLLEMI